MDNIRIILAALWVAVGFCLVTGAILGLFKPGYIQGLIDGEIDGIKITQNVLTGNAFIMMMPAFMAILSLTLGHPAVRWLNLIICGVLMLLILMTYAYYLTQGVHTWVYYNVLKIYEVTLYFLIIKYSWGWL
ncbi:MAG: DUF6326 family protein [Candidatus Bathyarchaeota archaeon]|nr:DUF6326 family protein [Candidatus Bathyarchaeota archaeon]